MAPMTEIHSLSARSFSHALIPFGLAFRLYDAFSVAVQRKCTCSVPRSLAGKGGLPLFLGWFMAALWSTQIILATPPDLCFNVYTLNQEAMMKTTYWVQVDGGSSYRAKSLAEARQDRTARIVHEYRDGNLFRSIELERSAEIARLAERMAA